MYIFLRYLVNSKKNFESFAKVDTINYTMHILYYLDYYMLVD